MTRTFSLVIPAHDAADSLPHTLASVTTQTRPYDQVVVVADRCTDETTKIARSAGMRVLTTDHGHPGAARNSGLDVANGTYVCFLDADDYYVRVDALERIERRLDETRDPDILHFGFMWGRDVASAYGWRAHSYGCVWARVWSRHAIGTHRFGREPMAEDLAFCKRVFAAELRHEVLDDVLLQYVFPNPRSFTARWIAAGRPT